MPTEDTLHRLHWLPGIALLAAAEPLPMLACASNSALRVGGRGDGEAEPVGIETVEQDRPGLRLIVNDDHGMAPSVTFVNQTAAVIVLRKVYPSVLSTDNGTYDLEALLASGPRRIEPGRPLVIRVRDIGRNAGEPFRVGDVVGPRRGDRVSGTATDRVASRTTLGQPGDGFGEPPTTPASSVAPPSNDQPV